MLITVPAPGAPIRLGNRVYTRALTHSAACGFAGVPGPPSVMIRLAATLALALACWVATRTPTRPGYASRPRRRRRRHDLRPRRRRRRRRRRECEPRGGIGDSTARPGMMRVGWRRGSDADRTQFFIAVHWIKTLCLKKPSAL